MKSNAFLDSIIEQSPYCVWISDAKGTLIRLNQACRDLLQVKDDEVIGKYNVLQDGIIKEQGVLPLVRQVFENGKAVRFNLEYDGSRLKSRDRKERAPLVLDMAISPVLDARGEVTHAIVHQIDITETKRAEELLRGSEAKYRSIFETTGTATIIVEEDTTISLANTEFERLSGFRREEIEGKKSWMEFVAKDDLKRMRELHSDRRVDPDSAPKKYAFRFLNRQGCERDILLSATLIPGTKKTVASLLDITESKQAEEALRQSEEKYRLIAESTADIISINDLNLRFTYISPSIQRIRGFTVEEAMAQTLDQVLTPQSLKTARAVFEEEMKLLASGNDVPEIIRTMELEEYKKDGSVIQAEVSLSFLRDKDRKPVGILATTRDVTERKRTEEALRGNEQTLRRTFDQAPLGAAILSLDNRFQRVNAEFCRITGYSEQELLTLDFPAITHSDDLERNMELTRDMLAGKFDSYQMDKRYIRKDGKIVWVRLFDRIVKDASGKPIHFFPMVEDITERKQAEEALHRSEESARRLAEENAVMAEIGRIISSTLNIEEAYTTFSERVKKLLPYDRVSIALVNKDGNTLIGRYVEGKPVPGRNAGETFLKTGTLTQAVVKRRKGIIVDSEDGNEIAENYPGLLPEVSAGYRSFLSVPLISGDQSIGGLHFRSKQSGFYSEKDFRLAESIANQIAGAIANAQLYQKEKRMEKELLKTEERYRLLVDLSPLMVIVHQQGKFVYLNSATVKALGASKMEDLVGRSVYEVIHPDYWDMVKERIRQIKQGESVPPVEEKYIRLDKKVIDVELNHVQILDQDGPMILVMGRDITEQKKGAKEKAALEEQLQQAQKMEAIGTLAGGIAHDFNNILAGILGYAELAGLDIPADSKARYNLQQSIKSAHRAKELVQQILAFSRQGKQERKPLDIGPIIREGLKFLRSSLPATIEIRQKIEEDLGAIEADATQVYQILMNLCTNAAHAMGDDGGVLEVFLNKVDLDKGISAPSVGVEPGLYLRLRVRDTGHGMSPDILKKIFDPYFTTKAVGKGTGLGLSVVHGIVKNYGGGIAVSSEVGKGSTFDIYFPKIKTLSLDLAAEKIEPLPLGGHERILFVDDEQTIVEVGQRVLEHLGYEVVARTSSVEALEAFKAAPDRFDLVITDMTMPNMTGDKLAQTILTIRPRIPIILCTGFSEYISEEKAKALGIREFVMKPLIMKDLAKAIRKALDSRKKKKG